MARCLHETIQLSQDGEQTIVCGDCGREFGHIGRDEPEIFHAYTSPAQPVIVVALDPAGEQTQFGVAVTTTGRGVGVKHIPPCAKCKWAGQCQWASDGEDVCHA